MDGDGKLHITVTNVALDQAETVNCILMDASVKSAKGMVLTDKMDAHNTFEAPNAVETKELTDIQWKDGQLTFTVPPCGVVYIEAEME